MKKLLIVSCLVVVICAGCKKPAAPAATAPTAEQPAVQEQPTTVAGQTAPSTPTTAPGTTAAQNAPPAALPLKERCDLLQQKFFPVQLDRTRITVEYKGKMLDVYKKAGKATPDAAAQVANISQEMETKLNDAVLKYGFKSTADMNTQECQGFQPVQDPQVMAQMSELTNQMIQIDKELQGFTSSGSH